MNLAATFFFSAILAGCGGQLLGQPDLELASATTATSDGGNLENDPDAGFSASDAALPSCVWVYPAKNHTCGEGDRRIDSDAGSCACDPGTTCEAIDVAPGQDSGGEGSRVVGCAFRPGSAP